MAAKKSQSPDKAEIESLFRQFAATGDRSVRDQIIAQHMYLIQTVARRFVGLGEFLEDLHQEGALGLINAVDLYDVSRGVQFSTYATHLIDGQIRHYLRDKGKLIRQPAWVQEMTTKIGKAAEALLQETGRPATTREIAERLGAPEAQVAEILRAQERTKVASLDAPRSADGELQGPFADPEKLPPLEGGPCLAVEDRIFLEQAMDKLKTLERKVVYHFFYLDLNQTEIARRLGISVNYASYLLRGAVAKLKQAF
jgi:RNA polymerase sigma-B factor